VQRRHYDPPTILCYNQPGNLTLCCAGLSPSHLSFNENSTWSEIGNTQNHIPPDNTFEREDGLQRRIYSPDVLIIPVQRDARCEEESSYRLIKTSLKNFVFLAISHLHFDINFWP
jgi:hypothetical protein